MVIGNKMLMVTDDELSPYPEEEVVSSYPEEEVGW